MISSGKMLFVPVAELTSQWKDQISILLGSCFQNSPSSFSNDYYLLSFTDTTQTTLQSVFSTTGDNTFQTIWDVCSSTYGKSSKAIKELLTWYFTNTPSVEKYRLYVDFYNSYWDQVINLYAGFGFFIVGIDNNSLLMEKNTEPVTDTKTEVIQQANAKRVEFFTNSSNRAYNVYYPAKKLLELKMQLVTRPREYSGIFLFDDKFHLSAIDNLSTGNLTFIDIYDYPTICSIDAYGVFHFHTHPKGSFLSQLISLPSDQDIAALFNKFLEKQFVKHYVFNEDGIFSIGFSIKSFDILWRFPFTLPTVKNIVLPIYFAIVHKMSTLLMEPLRTLGGKTLSEVSVNPQKQSELAINYYIEEVLKIKHPDYNHSLFDIKFWSNELLAKSDIVSDFIVRPREHLNVCPRDYKANPVEFPLLDKQVALLNKLDAYERKKLESCETENIIIPFNNRNERYDLWQYCNPYSFQNVGELFTIIGNDDEKFKNAQRLIEKSVPFNQLIGMLQGKDMADIELPSQLAQQYRQQSDLNILTRLSERMSARDVQLLSRLGEGGFGTIWTGQSVTHPEIKVAVKQFRDKLSSDAIREIGCYAILQATGSKYTPISYGVSMVNNVPQLSIDLFTTSLQSYKKDKTSVKYLSLIMDHTRTGLAEIHKCGIIHRDIKPDNILLKFQKTLLMQAVIADFGLASSYCSCRGGTRGYYAPEIFSSGSNTMKSDIWSLGISLVDACFPNNEYPERGTVPHKLRDILDLKRFQILENMMSGDPWARHDLRVEILPQPSSARPVKSSVKISTLDTKISQHAEDIANRYFEKTGEQPNNNISQAAVAIAQKWLNKKVTGVNDIAQQWKIIMALNGLIYLKPI